MIGQYGEGKMKTNCKKCEHNELGVCQLCNKEIPISYTLGRNQGLPRICPLKGGKR